VVQSTLAGLTLIAILAGAAFVTMRDAERSERAYGGRWISADSFPAFDRDHL
jgi:hypothetical protein